MITPRTRIAAYLDLLMVACGSICVGGLAYMYLAGRIGS